jgi:hypothetical protein
LKRTPAALIFIAVLALSVFAWSAEAKAGTVVEVAPDAEQHVDERLVRRLVVLELSDVDVPAPLEADTSSHAPGLYVRIVADQEALAVELWDRGELQGTRRLSLRENSALQARRIALVSGVLVRQLRERRLLDNKRYKRRMARERARARQVHPPTIEAQPFLGAQGVVAWVPSGNGVVYGPRLSTGLRLSGGAELSLSAGLGSGAVHDAAGSPMTQWYELGVHPGYAARLAPRHALRFGLGASVAVVHVAEGRLADTGSETWTARAAGEVSWRAQLSDAVELELGAEAGALLRRLPLLDDESLGGLWLGLAGGVNLQ